MHRRACDRLAPVLEPGISTEVLCFTSDVFLYFLERELAQSERYGNYSTFLVCRLVSTSDAQRGKLMENTLQGLSRNIRVTDYLGMVDDDTAGIVLQNTTVENAKKVVSRLKEEVSLQLSALNGGSQFSLAFAVYPTEANTFGTLKSLAVARLADTVQ